MILDRFPEIRNLLPQERSQLIDELSELVLVEWESNPDILAILEERHAEYVKDPGSARPWSEVRERLRRKYLQHGTGRE
ncbi:MAG: hypothetical protein ABMA13_17560 [Chthoniobacteraceae bacterium]